MQQMLLVHAMQLAHTAQQHRMLQESCHSNIPGRMPGSCPIGLIAPAMPCIAPGRLAIPGISPIMAAPNPASTTNTRHSASAHNVEFNPLCQDTQTSQAGVPNYCQACRLPTCWPSMVQSITGSTGWPVMLCNTLQTGAMPVQKAQQCTPSIQHTHLAYPATPSCRQPLLLSPCQT